jgi:hypothetical protein
MVKMLNHKAYENWVKRAFMGAKVQPQGIEIGKFYLFVYEDEKTGILHQAPIVAPLRFLGRGRFWGLNLVTLPRKDLRAAFVKDYENVMTQKSRRYQDEAAHEIYQDMRKTKLTSESLRLYKHTNIKSKVIEIDAEVLKDYLIRSVL